MKIYCNHKINNKNNLIYQNLSKIYKTNKKNTFIHQYCEYKFIDS